jgi:hypothetical protein
VGINLLFHGCSWMSLALAVRVYNPAPSAQGNRLAGAAAEADAERFRA